jgi:hypothetical protein
MTKPRKVSTGFGIAGWLVFAWAVWEFSKAETAPSLGFSALSGRSMALLGAILLVLVALFPWMLAMIIGMAEYRATKKETPILREYGFLLGLSGWILVLLLFLFRKNIF